MNRRMVGAAIALTLAPGLAACGSGSDDSGGGSESVPGVTDDTITIAQIQAFGGDFSDAVRKSNEGLHVWIDYVNANGGIHGRQVVVKEYDHKETAEGGVAACRQLVSDDDVFLPTEFQGQSAHVTAANCLDGAGVPNLIWQAPGEYVDEWTNTYALLPTPEDMGKTTAHYVQQTAAPDDKIGLVYLDQDIYRTVAESFLEEAASIGLDVVDAEPIGYTGSSYVPQLERLKAAGVTRVVFDTIGQETAVLKDAEKLGYEPVWTGSMFVFDYAPEGNPGLYDDISGLKLTSAAPSATFDEFLKNYDEYSSGDYPDPNPDSMLAYGFAQVVTEVLELAGPDPTRDSLLEAMAKVQGFETGILGPLDWSDDHVGTDQLWPVVCCTEGNYWKSDGESSNFSS